MASTTLIPLSEYLQATYRPDCDFLEGELLERNLGEGPHAKLQGFFVFVFRLNQQAWGVRVLPEMRVQVNPQRFRIPDVTILRRSDPDELIVRVAPLLCIEVLSSKDTLTEIKRRAEDYRAMGVQHIWAIDPWERRAYLYTEGTFKQPEEGLLRIPGTPIAVSVAEVFAELDA